MKQLLYFLIGIMISCTIFGLSQAHANCVAESDIVAQIETQTELGPIDGMEGYSRVYVGVYVLGATDNYWPSWSSGTSAWRTFYINGAEVQVRLDVVGTTYEYCARIYDDYTVCIPDRDGDGIDDDNDPYPDDDSPFMARLVAYYTDDNTSTGSHTGEVWETDRGDYYEVGEIDPDDTGFIIQNGTWVTPDLDSPVESTTQPTINQNPISINPSTGTPSTTGGDSNFNDGVSSTGTETDNQALQAIQDNTSKTTDNIKRLGDYMTDINEAIQNMDRNLQAGITVKNEPDNSDDNSEQDQADAEAAQNEFNSVDVATHYGSGVFNGTLTDGEEYTSPGSLEDESFFDSFFQSNPLITAFDNSGFDTSGSVSSITLNLGAMGSHDLDLAPLQPGLILFGNLLFAFCSLGSLIMIVRG